MVETITFEGGLDSDSDDRFIVKGDYKYAMNIRNSINEAASGGTIESVKGNKFIFNLLSGVNSKCIGAYEDVLNRRTIFFIWRPDGKHGIFYYDWVNNALGKLFVDPILNLQENYLVLDIDRVGDLLYWNDRFNPPRVLNVRRIREARFKDLGLVATKLVPSAPNMLSVSIDSGPTGTILPNESEIYVSIYNLDLEETVYAGLATVSPAFWLMSPNPGGTVDQLNLNVPVNYPVSSEYNIRAIFYNRDPNDAYPEVVDEQLIQVIKYAPNYPPTADYISDLEKQTNNVKGSLWQFRYKYIYLDDEESSWSSISKIPLPTSVDSIGFNSDVSTDPSLDNGIKVFFNSGSPYVKTIKIAVRSGRGDFVLVKEIEKVKNGIGNTVDSSYIFYNDTQSLPIPLGDSNKNFDSVPIRANSQEVIDGQRLLYGGVLEGYDNVDIDADLSAVYYDADIDVSNVTISTPNPEKGVETLSPSEIFSFYQTITYTELFNGDNISFSVTITASVINTNLPIRQDFYQFEVPVDSTDTVTTIKNKIIEAYTEIVIKPYKARSSALSGNNNLVPSISILTGVNTLTITYTVTADSALDMLYLYKYGIQYSSYITQKTFKSGASHSAAIEYLDIAGRSGLGNTSVRLTEYVEYFNRADASTNSKTGRVGLRLTLKNRPPSWATHFQILYLGNTTILKNPSTGFPGFIQFSLFDTVPDPDGITNLGAKHTVKINNISDYSDNFYNAANYVYDHVAGDRIRLIYDFSASNYFPTYEDYIITKFKVDGADTFIEFYAKAGITISDKDIVEIYRPAKGIDVEQVLFKEIGEVYPIVNGFHVGNAQTQTDTLPCIIDIKSGDSYFRYRGQNVDFFTEDYHFDDNFTSNFDDTGRSNRIDTTFKQALSPTVVRYSDLFIAGTSQNGLSSFSDFSFETYDINNGAIQRALAEENRVIVFQELKVGFILVNENVIYNADGSENGSGLSNKILSRMNYYAGEYGIGNKPESLAAHAGNKYFVDPNRGEVLRLDNSGLNVISNNKMSVFFRDALQKRLALDPTYRAYGVYDVRHGQYVVCFAETGDLEPFTIAFSQSKNRWESQYSFYPEMVCGMNQEIVSWKDGKFYIHGEGDYNTFYGVRTASAIEVVANNNPKAVKFWSGISLDSNVPWAATRIYNVDGQDSDLIVEDFRVVEGDHFAAFLRDVNSDEGLLNGDVLRSHELVVRLEHNSNTYARLAAVGIRGELSQLTAQ